MNIIPRTARIHIMAISLLMAEHAFPNACSYLTRPLYSSRRPSPCIEYTLAIVTSKIEHWVPIASETCRTSRLRYPSWVFSFHACPIFSTNRLFGARESSNGAVAFHDFSIDRLLKIPMVHWIIKNPAYFRAVSYIYPKYFIVHYTYEHDKNSRSRSLGGGNRLYHHGRGRNPLHGR
jgi:hypothetical protein